MVGFTHRLWSVIVLHLFRLECTVWSVWCVHPILNFKHDCNFLTLRTRLRVYTHNALNHSLYLLCLITLYAEVFALSGRQSEVVIADRVVSQLKQKTHNHQLELPFIRTELSTRKCNFEFIVHLNKTNRPLGNQRNNSALLTNNIV